MARDGLGFRPGFGVMFSDAAADTGAAKVGGTWVIEKVAMYGEEPVASDEWWFATPAELAEYLQNTYIEVDAELLYVGDTGELSYRLVQQPIWRISRTDLGRRLA